MKTRFLLIGLLVAGIAYGIGCGKPDPTLDANGMINVNGNAIFGSQCPYGTLSNPVPRPVYLWDCPLGLETVELKQPLRPLVFQADCKKKIIIARTIDGELDTSWEVLPDGTFSFTVDGGYAYMKDDGQGNRDCSVRVAAEISGHLECGDRDKVKIVLESVWWLDRVAPAPISPRPSPSVSPTPMPTPTPSHTFTPVPNPTPLPSATVTPRPTVTVTPQPTPTTPQPTVTVTPHPTHAVWMTAAAPEGPKCRVQKSCYLFAAAELQQCE